MFYPGFEYISYYTPDTSELIIISINLYKIVDSALQSAYKWEVAFHHGNIQCGVATTKLTTPQSPPSQGGDKGEVI